MRGKDRQLKLLFEAFYPRDRMVRDMVLLRYLPQYMASRQWLTVRSKVLLLHGVTGAAKANKDDCDLSPLWTL
jgi:hypothetical protein